MSKGNWRDWVAVGLVISLIIVPLFAGQLRQQTPINQKAVYSSPYSDGGFASACAAYDSVEEVITCQREEADLRAQQDMAKWALIVALVSIPGLIVSGLGLWALYWTFAKTREISKSQERAVLSVYAIRFGQHNSVYDWIEIDLGIKNTGKTHAESVYVTGRLDFDPGAIEGQERGAVGTAEFVCHGISFLEGDASGVVSGYVSQNFDWSLIGSSSKLYAMTGECRRESLAFSGFIHWTDIFGDKRKAPFDASIWFRSQSGDTWISVGSNSTAAKRFEDQYKKNS